MILDYTGIYGFAPFAMGCGALALSIIPLVAVGRLAPPIESEQSSGVVSAARAVPIVAVGAFVAGSKYSLTTSSLYVLFEVILYFHAVRVFANLVHQEKAKEIMFRFVHHVDTFFIWLGITKNIE